MRLPSTQALRALEAFARHGTIWQAAAELNITRSAVSHQLRFLEQDLGFVLLQRAGKGVALTPQGKRYAADVRKALTVLTDAAVQYGDRGVLQGAITVSSTPGFASFWLCTHVAEFKQLYPDVTLRVVTPQRLDDVDAPGVDAFIAYGDGDWPRHSVELLSAVDFMPVCSPALLNQIGGLGEPVDVFRTVLLHLDGLGDWLNWFAAAGIVGPNVEQGVIFSDMNLVLAAAIAGQGIAIGDNFVCRHMLDTGRLVRPFDLAIRSSRSYYFVTERARAGNPAIQAFADWLKSRLVQTTVLLHP
ncbi:LysR family glycine cleavage system transcriptional activator [Ancylobacter sp. 3268]|uniref:LysR substrate-binding domain-containing protein n=1 Tax=Ancylobacter sp. 3268 TaxID=2817752 RepID=UPI0028543E48|nr:LysR substrate-binding domain-containing protein [Ancylobacter sp. 3268]MDR6953274.1 LysR family glycine cleavage system transcriptional activator [Ancylobacter sp. 3268]